jgi:hypothetical protein
MGEVYRARDPRLGRTVAIKVLPAAVSADPSRRHRFEHEARAAGQLNHPNVLAVHDVGDREGTPYLVTELLEGETLRERLQAGALPSRKATDHALQVARGLAAAHDKGIVHRDLKPENLFLTKDGIVKILDFGLARLERAPEPGNEATATVTTGTEPGTVMGTVGYMSPEQVRGEAADHRSDLFALGAVLYEMLTGRRAFHRDSSVETLNAILKEEPEEFPPERQIPPALDRVVRHCLEKKPEERFQSARDLAFELEGLTGSAVTAAKATAPAVGRWRRRVAGAVIGLSLLGALAVAFLAGRRTASPTSPAYRQVTFGRGFASSGRFTPDGKTVVYSAAWDGGPPAIHSLRTDAPESRALGLPPGHVAGVSSKGELALLLTPYPSHFQVAATLARVPLSGGTPRPVAEGVTCADWAPDGETLAVLRPADGKDQVEFPVGKVLAQRGGCPRFSPRGDRLAFGTPDGYQVIETATGRAASIPGVPENGHSLWWAWSPDGEEIWFSASDADEERPLEAVSLSGRRRVLDRIAGSASLFDVSRDGVALVEHGFVRWRVLSRAPGEDRERDLSVFDRTVAVDISADGRTVLLVEWGAAVGATEVAYLRSTDGSPPMRLGEAQPTSLSPDGRWVLARQKGEQRLLPTGAGEARALAAPGLEVLDAGWAPDGKRVLLFGREPGRQWRGLVLELDSGRWRAVTPEGMPLGTLWASDGRHAAAVAPTGRVTLYPLDGGASREVAGLEPGMEPLRFSVDGRSLLVARPRETPLRIYRVDLTTGRRALVHELVPPDPAGVSSDLVVVTPDGRGYAYTYRQVFHNLYLVDGLK